MLGELVDMNDNTSEVWCLRLKVSVTSNKSVTWFHDINEHISICDYNACMYSAWTLQMTSILHKNFENQSGKLSQNHIDNLKVRLTFTL